MARRADSARQQSPGWLQRPIATASGDTEPNGALLSWGWYRALESNGKAVVVMTVEHEHRIDFTYLSQEDLLRAGCLDFRL